MAPADISPKLTDKKFSFSNQSWGRHICGSAEKKPKELRSPFTAHIYATKPPKSHMAQLQHFQ
jgi:hypothetical protein